MYEKTRFDEFVEDEGYLRLKNYFYHYLVRKAAIEKEKKELSSGMVLDLGCGISPMVPNTARAVFSDVSFKSMGVLKREGYTTAVIDATKIAFRDSSFDAVVCSEVLEHVERDGELIGEAERILKPGGIFILTVPLHKYYWMRDDAFVGHKRRYDLKSLRRALESGGLKVVKIRKTGNCLDRLFTYLIVTSFMGRKTKKHSKSAVALFKISNRIFFYLVNLLTKITPMALVSMALIKCRKVK